MSRHRFQATGSGSDVCRVCGDHRRTETHYSLFWHIVGQAFEMSWGLAWWAVLIVPLVWLSCFRQG